MCGPHASLCSSAASHPTYGPSHPDPAGGSFKQNRISSVSEQLFSFSLLYLIRKAEHDFYATLALRSPKAGVRPGRWNFKQNRISSVFERLLGRPLGRIANGVRRHYLSY